MFGLNEQPRQATSSDLQRVIEPLADYICATDRPRAALNQALAVLTHKVEQMNTLARVHMARRGAGRFFEELTATRVEFASCRSTRR